MNKLIDIGMLLGVVTLIMVMARPSSQGPSLINAVGGAFSGALATAGGATPTGFTAAK